MDKGETKHSMKRRSYAHDYCRSGIYHVTISTARVLRQPLGRMAGQLAKPDGDEDAPHVALSAVGQMVEEELRTSIHRYYPMLEVQDYVVMPEHLHFLLVAHGTVMSRNGRPTHLGRVIAGFKQGCNRRYWTITGQGEETQGGTGAAQGGAGAAQGGAGAAQGGAGAAQGGAGAAQGGAGAARQATQAAKPPATLSAGAAQGGAGAARQEAQAAKPPATLSAATQGGTGVEQGGSGVAQSGTEAAQGSVCGDFVATSASTSGCASDGAGARERWRSGRTPLFEEGYCDVMPVDAAQLATQRAYIRANPRSRLMRMSNRAWLQPRPASVDTAVSVPALRGYLQRECGPHLTEAAFASLEKRLLLTGHSMHTPTNTAQPEGQRSHVVCDSYGNLALLEGRCLPMVCHRRDAALFQQQKKRCLEAATAGAVLVSARIARGEQEIVDTALLSGYPVARIEANGFPDIYHPSADRMDDCAAGNLLLITPWHYQFVAHDEAVSVPFCKTMNCVVQAVCKKKDDWWR